jgi:hypothetical protein
MKDYLDEQYHAETEEIEKDRADSKSNALQARLQVTEIRVRQEREWARCHPVEWSAWLSIQPLLIVSFDFGTGWSYDFSRFLAEVGDSPSPTHVIQRRDKNLSYSQGNLLWEKQQTRQIDSPYLNVAEAAEYCRCAKKTILNHHYERTIHSVNGTRPLLFRREELDRWLLAGHKAAKKGKH